MAQKARNGNMGKVMAGVGLATLAAAAAGAAFLYGTDAGKKRRKQIKSWSLRMWADVMDEMEKMKDWSETAYNQAVTKVSQKYKKAKHIDPAELAALVSSLRGHWKNIRRQVEGNNRRSTPRRRTTARKSSRRRTAN